ncbi:spore coat protein [Desulfovirgula thermocuniculi]|uniref:spore coat protein n=1 Tax=Desulfovirgula thermocuniculi TaxID=348842 RepID=UPI000413F72E|nr:spore coat protein [Desulfovirgula thermocuniculi]
MEFTDRDILTDMLIGTKMLSMGYHMAVLEAANDRVRNTLIHINNEEMNAQKQIFDLMHARGWYPLDPVYTGRPMGPEVTRIQGPEGPMGRVAPGTVGPGPETRTW